MSLRLVLSALGLSALVGAAGALPAAAQATPGTATVQTAADPARVSALGDTMLMTDILEVMREEGIDYADSLADEMFPGKGGADWSAEVAQIYDTTVLRARFDAAMTEALAGVDLTPIEAFYGSARGQEVLRLEIEARRALLDQDVEDAAKLAWEDMEAEDGPRAQQLKRFADVNDLVESNVMGAMNANLAFYRGLAESGMFGQDMTEDQMLSEIWGQEADVRAETTDWLFPFLSLSYQPLSDEGLEDYIAFSESEAGQSMNGALFAAFDKVFTQISLDLGRAAARQMQGEDI